MTLPLFGVTLLAATAVAKEVVVLSTANFSETVGTKLWLIKFYAPVRSEAIHERARAQLYRPFANPSLFAC